MKDIDIALIQPLFETTLIHPNISVEKPSSRARCAFSDRFRFNEALILEMVIEATDKGAQLIVTPETCLDGWSADSESAQRCAQHADGPFVSAMKKLAVNRRVWICVGFFERERNGALYNTAVVVTDRGETAVRYRKTHEAPSTLERIGYTLGNSLEIAETPWGRAGILICHDRWIPETWRALSRRGMDFLLLPVATPTFHPSHEYYEINRAHIRSCAYREGIYALCCNAACHGGHSFIVDPKGNVVAEAGDGQTVLFFTLKGKDRRSNTYIASPRPTLYQPDNA